MQTCAMQICAGPICAGLIYMMHTWMKLNFLMQSMTMIQNGLRAITQLQPEQNWNMIREQKGYNRRAMTIINPDSAGKERTQLSKGIVLAIRELAKQTDPGPESRDMAAFIALALAQISAGIDISVAAWEKRGYWVKADKFRMDWLWSGIYADKMRAAVLADDWATVALTMTQVAQKLAKIQIPAGHRLGRPWVGAFKRLRE
jgi:hypothetical protein